MWLMGFLHRKVQIVLVVLRGQYEPWIRAATARGVRPLRGRGRGDGGFAPGRVTFPAREK